MNHHPARTVAGVLIAGLLLAGCSGDPQPGASSGSPSASAAASAQASGSASPSSTSTLTAEERQAFEEATKVVLAYRQTLVDLYSGARTRLNDLNAVASGDLLDRNLTKAQSDLGAGQRSEPQGVRLSLVSAEPLAISLGDNVSEVVVRACIDATAVTSVAQDGSRSPGVREMAEYTLIRTDYLPAPGWAVTRTQVAQDPGERKC
jgi:hypothetical protein